MSKITCEISEGGFVYWNSQNGSVAIHSDGSIEYYYPEHSMSCLFFSNGEELNTY